MQIYELLHPRGFEILAFPSNEFGGQEPHAEDVIEKFVQGYNVKFPMFGKIKTNGADAHPIFKYLKAQLGGVLGSSVKWNFTKFLCNRAGKPVRRYGPPTAPTAMVADIQELLAEPVPAE